jgi:ethanolamine utilization protein EutQ (cupin superfamily)
MKNIVKVLIISSLLFNVSKSRAQTAVSKVNQVVNKEQHISIDEFPKNMAINHLNGWGGMTVAINELPSATDFAPLLEGLKNNSCQVPHWGYIIKGSLKLKYDDGKEVILKSGDVFYMSPGHNASVLEDLKIIDFSPEKPMKELINHIDKKIAASKPKQ